MSAQVFALLNAEGTACSETALSAVDFAVPAFRAQAEATATSDGRGDTPVLGSWADVTGNEVCEAATNPESAHV